MTLNDLIRYLEHYRKTHPGSGNQTVGVSIDDGEWHARLNPPLVEEPKTNRAHARGACSDLEFHIP